MLSELFLSGEQQYSCTSCTFSLNSELSLRRHVRDVHLGQDKGTICQVCGRQLKRRESMKRHLQVRVLNLWFPLKKYNVPWWDTSSKFCVKRGMPVVRMTINHRLHCTQMWLYSQTVHNMKDSDEEPILCSTCGKVFREKSSLNKHNREVHTSRLSGKLFSFKNSIGGHFLK